MLRAGTSAPRYGRRRLVTLVVAVVVLGLVAVGVVLATGRSAPADPQVADPPVSGTPQPDGGTVPAAAPTPTASPADAPTAAADLRFIREVRSQMNAFPQAWPIVRGVYSTMYSFWGKHWDYIMNLVRTTEVNAVVIDVKDDSGALAWHMDDLPAAVQGGGADWIRDGLDPRTKVQELRDAGGYPIARVVCFKDSKVAKARPDLAVIDTRTGQPWQGKDGEYWLNPYNDAAWQYCIDVGKEAAKMGFLEVQFDYVRFPNGGDGPSEFFSFPGVPGNRPRSQWRNPDVITKFLTSAREQLHQVGVRVSADVFGLTTYNWSWDGDGTGQVFERLAEQLDYISPMVYPSHYGPGNYGLYPHPVYFPYETVWNAMQEARMRSQGLRAKVRPWLEDFSPTWLGVHNTPQRVRDQKRAVYENGIDSWMLWNAGNRFTTQALAPTTISHADPTFQVPPRTRDPEPDPGEAPRHWPGYATTDDGTAKVDGPSVNVDQGNAAGTNPHAPAPSSTDPATGAN